MKIKDFLPSWFGSTPGAPPSGLSVVALDSGPVPDGAITISLSPSYEQDKLFVSDLGKRGLHVEHDAAYDLGALYTQKQINDSYELKTFIATGVILTTNAGTTPSKELVDATVTINPGEITIGAIELKDGVVDIRQTVKSDGTNNAAVVIQNAPTPGVATSAKQDTGNASLASIDAKVLTDTELRAAPVPVSVASLPLPAGASTSANQTTGNASLASIDGKIPASPSQEHTTAASPHSARLSDGAAFYKATTPADTQPVSAAALPLPAGASTSANQTTGNASLASIDGKLNSLGQKTAANSVPVVLASDQPTLQTDVVDEATRELGRVLASDVLFPTEVFSTSVVTYANARPVNGDLNTRHYTKTKIIIKNTSANGARINIFGSVDSGSNWDEVIVNNTALAAGNVMVTDLTAPFTTIRIEARAAGAGNLATVESRAYSVGS